MMLSINKVHPCVIIYWVLMVAFAMPVLASVKYRFVITEQPANDFFKPMVAEMVLSIKH